MAYLIADLKALTTNPEPLFKGVMVLGLTAIDDGGGGLYHWNATATNVGDNAEWVVPNDNQTTGRWQRIAKNLESGAGITTANEAGTAVNSAAADADVWKRWTAAGIKTLTIVTGQHAANDVLHGINLGAGLLTIEPGAGITLSGSPLTYAQYRSYAIVFSSATAADVVNSPDTSGTLAVASGGTGSTTAAAAFATLKQQATETATGVVELATSAETTAGLVIQASDTRIHIPVTVSGTPNYVTLSGQDLVRALVNLSSHVTGTLPFASVAGRTVVTEAAASHTNAATDRDKWIRFTGGSAKTWTISSGVAAATEVWMFLNVGAGNLNLVGSGVTLTGNLVFAPLNGGFIYFTSTSAADVIGGTAT